MKIENTAFVFFNNKTHSIPIDTTSTILELKVLLEKVFLVSKDQHILTTLGGFPCSDGDSLNLMYQLRLKVCGGKGGFGSLLKSQGDRMATRHSINVDSCRDLSGRRIGAVREAKR